MGVWTWIGLILGLYWLGAEVYKWSKRNVTDPTPAPSEGMEAPDDEASEDEPLRSLVLLLDAPRDISDTAWIEHVGSALGLKFFDLFKKIRASLFFGEQIANKQNVF